MSPRRSPVVLALAAVVSAVALVALAACGDDGSKESAMRESESKPEGGTASLTLTSEAFADQQPIPEVYTCDGDDTSPPLAWRNPPAGTAAWALIVDDPDAPRGTWVHWVVYDIPAGTMSLPPGAGSAEAPGGGVPGSTSWRKTRYGGPCPPPGKPHHYVFQLYALKAPLSLPPGATKEKVIEAIGDRALARAVLKGTYRRG